MYNLITQQLNFKGNNYKIACIALGEHPSFYSFNNDEVTTRNSLWNIKPGDYVFDVGASYGSYTLTALASGAEKVWSWSPQDHGYLSEKIVLEQSLILNGWQNRCIVYDCGMYDKKGWLNTFTQDFFVKTHIFKIQML